MMISVGFSSSFLGYDNEKRKTANVKVKIIFILHSLYLFHFILFKVYLFCAFCSCTVQSVGR